MKEIVEKLLDWFDINKRDLEWRRQKTPYTILISEVMLQQTRVESVRSYFTRFIQELPDFKALADCPIEKLLKLWEGLGYYNRARNLKNCAIEIMNTYQGIFPNTYEQAIKLPGIGDYTCGAILSLAYNKKYAAVDGNVLRVLARYTCSSLDVLKAQTKIYFKQELEKIIPDEAGRFNEALIELGATICMPKKALCEICPLSKTCKAHQQNNPLLYPVRIHKGEKKLFEYTVLFLTDGSKYIFINKPDGVLKGLPSPILVDSFLTPLEALDYASSLGFTPLREIRLSDKTHTFTHQKWFMRGYILYVEKLLDYKAYSLEEIKNRLGIPTCFRKYLTELI